MPVTLIEKQTTTLEYGLKGTLAIVDHPKLGRLLLTDGYGGENTPRGGASVRVLRVVMCNPL